MLFLPFLFWGVRGGEKHAVPNQMNDITDESTTFSLVGLGRHAKYMNSKMEPNTICLLGLPVIYLLTFSQGNPHEMSQARQLKTVVSDTTEHGQ